MSKDRTGFLGIVLLSFLTLLSLKGVAEFDLGEGVFIPLSLPPTIVAIKNNWNILFVINAVFLTWVVIKEKSTPLLIDNPKVILIFVPLIYYHFISYWVGSQNFDSLISCILILYVLYVGNWITKTRSDRKYFVSVMEFYCGLIVVINIYIFAMGYGYPDGGGSRFFGANTHPNTLGAVMALVFGFMVTRLFPTEGRSRLVFLVTLIVLILSFALVFLSGSRGALLMCCAALLIAIFINKKAAIIFPILLLPSFFASIVFFEQFDLVFNRMINAPLDNRSEVWDILINDFINNIFFGVGDGSLVSGSLYLSAMAGMGLIFGLPFLFGWILFLVDSLALLLRSSKSGEQNVPIAVLLIVIAIGGFFEASFFDKLGITMVIAIFSMQLLVYDGNYE